MSTSTYSTLVPDKNLIEESTRDTQVCETNANSAQSLDFRRAVENFEIDGDSNIGVDPFIFNANILIDNGDYRLALNLLQKKLASDPQNHLVTLLMGECFLNLQEYELAQRCFLKSQNQNDCFDVRFGLGELYYLMGDDILSLENYLTAVDLVEIEDERLYTCYKNIGNILVRLRQYDQAKEYYYKAHAMNPNSDSLYVNFGTLSIQQSEWERALKYFRKAININSENERAWIGLALVHREFGDMELSWANIIRALDIAPDNLISIKLAIEWAYRDNKVVEISRRIESFLDYNPQNIEVSFLYCQVLCSLNRFVHASIEIEKVLALDPTYEGANDLKEFIKQSVIDNSGAKNG